MTESFSIVIPSYNGLKRLEQNLPSIVRAAEKTARSYEIVISDDGSTDGTLEWLAKQYPAVRTVSSAANAGFIAAANRGVAAASFEIVMLLNNDVRPEEGCFILVFTHFDDSETFAVTFKSLYPDSLLFREGAKSARFRFGFLKILHAERHFPAPLNDGRIPSLYPVGGHCAIRKSMFKELGGFDDLFAPFYWEDADLGWRGWKAGWKTVYEPAAVVVHDEQGTIKDLHGAAKARQVRYRNRLLFMWKNISDWKLRFLHAVFLALRVILSWAIGNIGFYSQWIEARTRRNKMLSARIPSLRESKGLSDSGVLRLFKKR